MFDMHYDLLTILYTLKDNKLYIKKVINNINNNLTGLTANLYFMNKKEMKEELRINKKINVSEMFKESLEIFNKLNIKPKTIFSIEGCDYIKNVKELEHLKKLGLNAILLVWNNKNKYGSGIRTKKGLTRKGKKLIQKAIDLDIAIDLSHTNEKTFFDIINVMKKHPKKAICYASHSNIYNLCNNPRNLKDNQLKALKDIDGYLGIVAYPPFLTTSKNNTEIKTAYLNHIKYAINIMGIDKIFLATDNLEFYNILDNKDNPPVLFKYKNIKNDIENILKKEFDKDQIYKIMFENAKKLYFDLKFNQKFDK